MTSGWWILGLAAALLVTSFFLVRVFLAAREGERQLEEERMEAARRRLDADAVKLRLRIIRSTAKAALADEEAPEAALRVALRDVYERTIRGGGLRKIRAEVKKRRRAGNA